MNDRENILKTIYELSEQFRNSFATEEEYLAHEHWVNNPLIKPISKYDMIQESEARAFKSGRDYERNLISDAIKKHMDEYYEDLEDMRNKMATTDTQSIDYALLEEDSASTFLYITGLNGALRLITIMEKNEQA